MLSCHMDLQTDQVPLKKGDIIKGFTIGKRLGKGAFGEVFTASAVGKTYALKEIACAIGAKREDRQKAETSWRAENEALLVLVKEDVLVPTWIDSFQRGANSWIIVMKCIKSPKEKLCLSTDKDVIHFLLDCLSTLRVLHRKLIHRDIKPGNVKQDMKGRIWILDFGISKSTEKLQPGKDTKAGTPGFIAPEVERSHTLPCSDIYSLGATVILLSLPKEDPGSKYEWSDVVPKCKLSDWLKNILLKMVQQDYTKRYQNCQEVIDDLLMVPIPTPENSQFNSWHLGRLHPVERETRSYSTKDLTPANSFFNRDSHEIVIKGFLIKSLELLHGMHVQLLEYHGDLRVSSFMIHKKTRDVWIVRGPSQSQNNSHLICALDLVALGKVILELVQMNRDQDSGAFTEFKALLTKMVNGDFKTCQEVLREVRKSDYHHSRAIHSILDSVSGMAVDNQENIYATGRAEQSFHCCPNPK